MTVQESDGVVRWQPPHPAVKFIAGMLISLIILCALAVHELNFQKIVHRVPNGTISSVVCQENGGTNFVTTRPSESDIYYAHCNSGITLETGDRPKGEK